MLDLKHAGDLTQTEHLEVASNMQALLINELMHVRRWTADEAVLHGGSSVRMRWGSTRFSEDLNFMVSENCFGELEGIAKRVIERVRAQASMLWPDCQVDCTVKTRNSQDGLDVLNTWDVRWRHPNRRNKVQVKLDFYRTDAVVMRDYRATASMLSTPASRVRVRGTMPTPDLVSLWGDKVKAIATRPHFKWRDIHDLGFVAGLLSRVRDTDLEQKLYTALETSCRVYGKSIQEVVVCLRNVLDSGVMENYVEFNANMENWFGTEEYSGMVSQRYFDGLLDEARVEVERAIAIVEATQACVTSVVV